MVEDFLGKDCVIRGIVGYHSKPPHVFSFWANGYDKDDGTNNNPFIAFFAIFEPTPSCTAVCGLLL
jgi:hypothetical protein